MKKQVDLLGFQKSLNEQFLEIFENKKLGLEEGLGQVSDQLGLMTEINNMLFFTPLGSLKSIAMKNNIENLLLTAPWLMGISQERGDVYSIISLENIIKTIIKEKIDVFTPRIDDKLVFLQPHLSTKIGLLLKDLKLEYSAEFTKVIEFKYDNLEGYHEFSEGVEFDSFILKKNMNQTEWDYVNILKAKIEANDGFVLKEFEDSLVPMESLIKFTKDVYLDAFGKRPIFVLNTENLINYILTLKPY